MATASHVLRELQVIDKHVMSRDPDAETASVAQPASSTFVCFFCDTRYTDKSALQRHQDCCRLRTVGLQSVFVRLPAKLENAEEDVSVKHGHLENIGLVSTRKAGALADRKCVSCDVIVISDNDEDENRTKSVGPHRSSHPSSADSRDMGFKTPRSIQRLLNIDVCSPLGHRLCQYLQPMPVLCDITSFSNFDNVCRTDQPIPMSETIASESSSRTDRHHQRREHLPNFPVTFSCSRRCRLRYCHRYKFTRKQQSKFCIAFDTGLDTRSRHLAKRMKPCCVALNRLQISTDAVVRMPQYEDICKTRGNCSHDAYRARPKHVRKSVQQMTSASNCRTESCYDADAAERSATASAAEAEHPAAMEPVKKCVVVLEDCRRLALSDDKSHPTPPFPLPDIEAVDVIAPPMIVSAPNDDEPPEHVSTQRPSSASCSPQSWLTMKDDLPPLTFHCDICSRVVDCKSNARRLVGEHFAEHGIADVELAYVTMPDGAHVIQLVQRQPTVVITPSGADVTQHGADVFDLRPRQIRGILRTSSSSSRQRCDQSASRDAQQAATSVPARKRVRWADELSIENLLDDDEGWCAGYSEVHMQCCYDDQASDVAAATSSTPPCGRYIPSYHYSPYPPHTPERHRPTEVLPSPVSDDVIIDRERLVEYRDDGCLHFQPLSSSAEVVQIDDSDEFASFTDNNNCSFPLDNQTLSSDIIDLESRGRISSEECLGLLATLLQTPSSVSGNLTLFDAHPKVNIHHPAMRSHQRSPCQVVPDTVSPYDSTRSSQICVDIICID